jgi:hypothetical protein
MRFPWLRACGLGPFTMTGSGVGDSGSESSSWHVYARISCLSLALQLQKLEHASRAAWAVLNVRIQVFFVEELTPLRESKPTTGATSSARAKISRLPMCGGMFSRTSCLPVSLSAGAGACSSSPGGGLSLAASSFRMPCAQASACSRAHSTSCDHSGPCWSRGVRRSCGPRGPSSRAP